MSSVGDSLRPRSLGPINVDGDITATGTVTAGGNVVGHLAITAGTGTVSGGTAAASPSNANCIVVGGLDTSGSIPAGSSNPFTITTSAVSATSCIMVTYETSNVELMPYLVSRGAGTMQVGVYNDTAGGVTPNAADRLHILVLS